MIALFDSHPFEKRTVQFFLRDKDLKAGDWAHIIITGLELEDFSKERWLFKGYEYRGPHTHDAKVSGYFDCVSRTGWIEIQ
jgi:hypothetical protein